MTVTTAHTTKLWNCLLIIIAGYYYIIAGCYYSNLIVMFSIDDFGVSDSIDEISVRGCTLDFGLA